MRQSLSEFLAASNGFLSPQPTIAGKGKGKLSVGIYDIHAMTACKWRRLKLPMPRYFNVRSATVLETHDFRLAMPWISTDPSISMAERCAIAALGEIEMEMFRVVGVAAGSEYGGERTACCRAQF